MTNHFIKVIFLKYFYKKTLSNLIKFIFNWDYLLLASHPEARNIVDRDYLLLASHPEARTFTYFVFLRQL